MVLYFEQVDPYQQITTPTDWNILQMLSCDQYAN